MVPCCAKVGLSTPPLSLCVFNRNERSALAVLCLSIHHILHLLEAPYPASISFVFSDPVLLGQDCCVGMLFALLPILGGGDIAKGVISMSRE